MADSEETTPTWRVDDSPDLARLHLERDTVSGTIDLVHRQTSLISQMLALLENTTSGATGLPTRDGSHVAELKQETKESATERCLAVTELLEKILLHLDPTEMFGVQRVSRTFRDTITESRLLRQRMLLEPSVAPHSWDYVHDFIGSRKICHATRPFEFQLFPHCDSDEQHMVIEVWIKFDSIKRAMERPEEHFAIEKNAFDVASESWRRIRLDMKLEVRYFALIPPNVKWPEFTDEEHISEGITLGGLLEKAVRYVGENCSQICGKDAWEALKCMVLRERYGDR
ncbi:Putative F-box domain-containing protein [Septoria linicola]|uniref:F-box domain-containing protein n=1 Tax=Septoria linicola TaxID=215465 RepID=A0A9Q9EQN1_9PEZI|nr:putative F-box domain-containing protein [Septoria linicola]USW59295.1 Putative F-box domain-containing protein [Septoria linicola]